MENTLVDYELKKKFLSRQLNDNEKVVYATGDYHWLFLVVGAMQLFVLPAIISLLLWLYTSFHYLAMVIILCALVATAVNIITWWLANRVFESIITTERVILRRGIISRSLLDVHLSKIQSVEVNQTLLHRIVDTGDVHIHSSSSDNEIIVASITHPFEFRKKVIEQMELIDPSEH